MDTEAYTEVSSTIRCLYLSFYKSYLLETNKQKKNNYKPELSYIIIANTSTGIPPDYLKYHKVELGAQRQWLLNRVHLLQGFSR